MAYWIDQESESDNVIVTSESAILIGSCDKEACEKTAQHLTNKNNPIEVLGTDNLKTIPFSQIQNIVSRSTDKGVDIRHKIKKDIEESNVYFSSIEEKREFISNIGQFMPEHLVKSEFKQSAFVAAISPLTSLILSLASAYLFFDKFR